jgi:hypothetical protein
MEGLSMSKKSKTINQVVRRFWKIEERVTRAGQYIVWDSHYDTQAAAEAEIKRRGLDTENCRAVLYQTGGWGTGPERVTA